MNRRPLIFGASAIAIAAAFGILRAARPNRIEASTEAMLEVIGREFGEVIAEHDEAMRFVTEAESIAGKDVSEAILIFAFLQTTNVVRALETGHDLIFLSFDDPITAPCQNTLSAHWL